MLPRTLKNFNCFMNNNGFAGLILEMEPPEVKIKTEKYRAGGMNGEKEIDMGTESMKAKFQFGEMNESILMQVGLSDTLATQLILKGAIRQNALPAQPVYIELHGSFDMATLGKWKSGEKADTDIEMNVGYYLLKINNQQIWEIDVDNMVRTIGTVDVLASERAAIGI